MRVEFTVPGTPVAKGRPRFVNRGRFVQAYTPDKTYNYEQLVKLAWMQAGCEKLNGPIIAQITAYMPIPKSESKKKKAAMEAGLILPTSRLDLDNICKAILDALNKIAYDDDGQIVELHARKLYSDTPRAEITLQEVDNGQA